MRHHQRTRGLGTWAGLVTLGLLLSALVGSLAGRRLLVVALRRREGITTTISVRMIRKMIRVVRILRMRRAIM